MNQYLIQYRPRRSTFLEDSTPKENEIVGCHFEYLKKLKEDGTLILAGRTDDASVGLFIFEAQDESAATEIMNSDPAVIGGVFSAVVKLFRLALIRS